MNRAIQDLERYLQNNVLGDVLGETIDRFMLNTLLPHLLGDLGEVKYKEALAAIEEQKRLNRILSDEMELISTQFHERNIKIIFFKGLTLSFDLYGDDLPRRCGDIDALVDVSDVPESLRILRDLGYPIDDEYFVGDYLARRIQLISAGLIHLPQFKKKVTIDCIGAMAKVDLHVFLSHFSVNKAKVTREIIGRAVRQSVRHLTVWLLELHDRLVHLLVHATKEHVKNDYFWDISGSRKKGAKGYLKLSLMHDVALLIDKYRRDLDWATFTERVIECEQIGPVLYSLVIVDRIYPTRIPPLIIEELRLRYGKSHDRVGFFNRSLEIILQKDADRLILSDPFDLIASILKEIDYQGPRLSCPKGADPSEIHDSPHFTVKRFMDYTPENDAPCIAPYDESDEDCSAAGSVCWNEDYLSLQLVINKVSTNHENLTGFSVYISDCRFKAELNAFIPRIVFGLDLEDHLPRIYVEYRDKPIELFGRKALSVSDSYYTISVSLPWSFLRITPSAGRRMLFYVELEASDMHGRAIRDHLSWVVGYNPILFGILTLV